MLFHFRWARSSVPVAGVQMSHFFREYTQANIRKEVRTRREGGQDDDETGKKSGADEFSVYTMLLSFKRHEVLRIRVLGWRLDGLRQQIQPILDRFRTDYPHLV